MRLQFKQVMILFVLASNLTASVSDLAFERLTMEDGLSQNSIYAIQQDRQGYLWVGTQDGLQRYDGHDIRLFRSEQDQADSLPDQFIFSLCPLSDGSLLVGTYNSGLYRFTQNDGRFTSIETGRESGSMRISAIVADGKGFVWVGTYAGLYRYEPVTGQAIPWVVSHSESGLPLAIYTILAERSSELLLGTSDGLFRLLDHELKSASLTGLTETATPAIHALLRDRRDRLWLAGSHGLAYMNPGVEEAQLFELPLPTQVSEKAPVVTSLLEDRSGTLWIGTLSSGLFRLEPGKNKAKGYFHDSTWSNALSSNRIQALFEDRSGVVWIGTANSGLNRARRDRGLFELFRIGESDGVKQSDANSVRALYCGPNKDIWVGGDSGGLMQFSENGELKAQYLPSNEKKGNQPVNLRVWSICARESELWIGGDSGLDRFEIQNKTFENIPLKNANGVEAKVRCMLWQGENLWLGTSNRGLLRYNANKPVEVVDYGSGIGPDATGQFVLALKSDFSGRLWVGTSDGLFRIGADQKSSIFRQVAKQPKTLSNSLIRALCLDSRGDLWVGTGSGLNRAQSTALDLEEIEFQHFSTAQGLPNDTIYAILEDRSGYLWLSTNRGLARLNRDTGEVYCFDQADGLQDHEFNGGAAFAAVDGNFFFGGVKGFNRFNPDKTSIMPFSPELVFHEIHFLQTGKRERIANTNQAEISYEKHPFTLSFSAMDFSKPKATRYSYRLDEHGENWIELGNRGEITFSSLASGSHSVAVRAKIPGGAWSKSQELKLQVTPPFWKSIWAIFGYVVLIVSLLSGFGLMAWRRHSERKSHQAEILANEARLKLALTGSGSGIWDWQFEDQMVHRTNFFEMLGYEPGELENTAEVRENLTHPDDRHRVKAMLERHLTGESNIFELEYRLRAKDGSWRWILDVGRVVAWNGDKPVRIVGTHRDITPRREAEQNLRLAAQVFDNTTEGIVILTPQFRVIATNRAFSEITGYQAEEVLQKDVSLFSSRRHEPEFYEEIRRTLLNRGVWHGEIWEKRKSGEIYPQWLNLSAVRDEAHVIQHYVGVFSDITERRKAEDELRYLANYDPLTHLPNRSLFRDRLDHALALAMRQESKLAVIFIDLDNFKHVNDTQGHGAGDQLLIAVSERLSSAVRRQDTVARLGGDEFTIILEGVDTRESVETVCNKLLEKFTEPYRIYGQEYIISPSIGISNYPSDGNDAETLLRHADMAMYYAKDRGKNTFVFFNWQMTEAATRRAALEKDLRHALIREQFYLVFQPQLDLREDVILHVEALLRWNHPERGPISPAEFIPLAEETGLIESIGEWVLLESCRQAAIWRKEGLNIGVSVNISARQFQRGDLVRVLDGVLDETGLPPELLEVELTESLVMEGAETNIQTLKAIKERGVRIAIDDFGTGYSSLNYLKRFPIDVLKIDKSFVLDLTSDPEDEAIVGAIIAMAHNLGLKVIAEGVETLAQSEFLRLNGCDMLQGYLISRPVRAERIPEICQAQLMGS